MKKFIIISLSIMLFSFSADKNEECNPYYLSEEGKTTELTSYNKKDKVTGKTTRKVLSKKAISGGLEIEIEANIFDKKDEKISGGTFNVTCKDGKLTVDMTNMVDLSQIQQFEGMDIDIQSESLDFPTNPTVGQELKGGKTTLTASNMGMKLFSQTIIIDKRKVEAIESKTCPAGTYECVKISYETRMQIGPKAFVYKSIDWIAKDIGTVRSETYEGGDLENYSELTKIY